MTRDRRETWAERHRTDAVLGAPSPFVLQALDVIARAEPPLSTNRALDLACGRGRHALLLAERGYRVEAVDFALAALTSLTSIARTRHLAVAGICADVGTWPVPVARYALVVVVNFLERELFPQLRAAIVPGGCLLYETYRHEDGVPSPLRPEFLLAPGELDELCRGWQVLDRADATSTHRGTPARRAGILARRPTSPH